MKGKPRKQKDELFKDMPKHVQALWAEAKGHKRIKDRAAFLAKQQSRD